MVPDIQEWATGYLMDGAGNWDLQKWEDLKAEFIITLILPRNQTFSPGTLEELQRYTDTAMYCISFLESAESLDIKNLGEKEVLEEKRWLYNLILSEIRECMWSLRDNHERNFPGVVERACTVLELPFKYAKNGLYVIEMVGHTSPTRH